MTVEAKELIATRAMIVIDNKVLLGKRGRGVGEGLFALVGGKPDPGETLEHAVTRETWEETGLTFKNVILWKEGTDSTAIPGESWHVFYFTGDTEGELCLKEDEITEVINVDRRSFENLDIAFNHRQILEEYFGLR